MTGVSFRTTAIASEACTVEVVDGRKIRVGKVSVCRFALSSAETVFVASTGHLEALFRVSRMGALVATVSTVFVTSLAVLVISLYALLAPMYWLFPVTVHRVICRLSEMGWSLFCWYGRKSLNIRFHYMDAAPLPLALPQPQPLQPAKKDSESRKVVVVEPGCATSAQLPESRWPAFESAFVCINHRGDMDWLVALCFAYSELHSLSFTKFFVKQSLLYVPLFGYGMLMTGFIFVRRKWENDKRRIEEAFRRILQIGKTIPLHLYCFLEGSRFTDRKREQCDEWVEKQTAMLASSEPSSRSGSSGSLDSLATPLNPAHAVVHKMRWVLQPRTKGFVASLKGLGDKLQAVYDLTIAYDRDQPVGFWEVLAQLGKRDVHVLVRRWPISQLPHSDEERSRWAFMLYSTKDAALDYFFDGPGNQSSFPPSDAALREYHANVYLPKMLLHSRRSSAASTDEPNPPSPAPSSKPKSE